MKRLAGFILLMIIMAATYIPCCGIDDCCADRPAAQSNANDHKQEGTCSPFSSCSTCLPGIEPVRQLLFVQPLVASLKHEQKIIAFSLPSYATSFWQPPRYC